jgi:hypothetical protein
MTTKAYYEICLDHDWHDDADEFWAILDSLPVAGAIAVTDRLGEWCDQVAERYFDHLSEISKTPDGDEIAARLGHELEDE